MGQRARLCVVMSNDATNNVIIQRIRDAAAPRSNNNVFNLTKIKGRMTVNDKLLYGSTDDEKDLILGHLNQRFLKIKNTKEDYFAKDSKHLLYFSIFLNDAYVDLLYMCLKSIVANTPSINFDVLFITDEITKAKIEQFDIISKFNVDYMISDSVSSGPMASMKKLDIFDYEKISDYSKILFLDADIICIRDLNIIFNKVLQPEKLYVCSAKNIHRSTLLLTPTHGIMHLSKEDADFINKNPDSTSFNAGQFLFLNSAKMKAHFENVRWLKSAWPGPYFYEQSFMNYYFVLRSLVEPLTEKFNQKSTIIDENFTSKEVWSEVEEQLVSVTFNIVDACANSSEENTPKVGSPLKNSRSKLVVSGATNSSHSRENLEKFTEMPEGVLTKPSKMHTDNTVAIHFVATHPTGEGKKKFINLYADAHKLHI